MEWHSHADGTISSHIGRHRVEKGAWVKSYHGMNGIRENPIIPNIMTIAMNMMTAKMEMAKAFSHPQSKKCFTSKSQSISWMMEARNPAVK